MSDTVMRLDGGHVVPLQRWDSARTVPAMTFFIHAAGEVVMEELLQAVLASGQWLHGEVTLELVDVEHEVPAEGPRNEDDEPVLALVVDPSLITVHAGAITRPYVVELDGHPVTVSDFPVPSATPGQDGFVVSCPCGLREQYAPRGRALFEAELHGRPL